MTLTARFCFTALFGGTSLLLSLAACQPHDHTPPQPVVTTPVDSSSVAMDTAHWTYFGVQSVAYVAPTAGKFEYTSEGVKATAENYRLGAFLLTRLPYTLTYRTIKVAWKPRDGGSFCNYMFSFADSTGTIYEPVTDLRNFEDLNNLSTRNVVGNSVVISSDLWYYTTIVTGNGTYTLSTATGNYSGSGGTVIENRSGSFTRNRGRISLRAGDPFGGSVASVVIHELSIR
ncbi:MAG: hypothetical protein EOO16_22720 [Chitinophagaceae bacterium]|nr:MAG: hypothetical protein EOO16_22720 [Chitinophagaceae bacterium]